jgi:hypothetical protein
MEFSSFFNSIRGDRKYKAKDWAAYFGTLIGNGVFPLPSTGLQIVSGEGMTITVHAGTAWINGYLYRNTDDLPLTIDTAEGVLKRIDRIVIRWDLTARKISAAVKKGTPASSPAAPALQRDADAYELCLADVLINAGVTQITGANITDQRLNGELCGIVAGLVNQIDTTAFNAQLQAWFALYQQQSNNEFQEFISYLETVKGNTNTDADNALQGLITYLQSLEAQGVETSNHFEGIMGTFQQTAQQQFSDWFTDLQATLDEDTAGNLFNLILDLTNRMNRVEKTVFDDVSENPFKIQFDNLNGIKTSGIWNQDLQRIEA